MLERKECYSNSVPGRGKNVSEREKNQGNAGVFLRLIQIPAGQSFTKHSDYLGERVEFHHLEEYRSGEIVMPNKEISRIVD